MKRFPDILKHTWPNWRVFKSEKRREARVVDEALSDLRMGCAYMSPAAYRLASKIMDDMKELRKQLSCKEWGR